MIKFMYSAFDVAWPIEKLPYKAEYSVFSHDFVIKVNHGTSGNQNRAIYQIPQSGITSALVKLIIRPIFLPYFLTLARPTGVSHTSSMTSGISFKWVARAAHCWGQSVDQ